MKRKWKWIIALVLVLTVVLSNAGYALAQPKNNMVRVLIGFTQQPRTTDQNLIRNAGGTINYRYQLIPAIAAQVPERAVPQLQRILKNAAYVELDGEVEAIAQTLPWGVDRIDAELVHPYNKGNGVKVAIIDTGIDLYHEDLNVAGGVSYISGNTNGDDDNGHGTHCAGIVAALDNNVGVIGVAPEAELYAVKVLDYRGRGYWSDVIRGIEWAVNNDMDVINMSLGSSGGSNSLKQACDNAYNGGVVVVAAAGNSGSGSNTVLYPARYDSVIAVAATTDTDVRASFSSTGPSVELAAPGADIYSTYYDNRYRTLSGTSMASPHAVGVAALIIASGITDTNGNSRINDEVRTRLQETADDLGSPGRDSEYGYGLVNAAEAAAFSGNNPPVADAGEDQTVLIDTEVTLDGSGSYDPDGDSIVSYLWTQTGGTNVELSDNTVVNPTFTPAIADTYEFDLVVNDGDLTSSADGVAINVRAANSPPSAPVVDVIPDAPVTTDNLVCNIPVPSTDADGDPITYSYAWYKGGTLQPGLTTNTVASSNTARGQLWECEVTPNDGTVDGPAGNDQVIIGNSLPVADAGPNQAVLVGTEVTLDGTGSYDLDDDAITYLWTQTGGPEVNPFDNTAVEPAFTPNQAGTYTFQLVVNDGSDSLPDTVSVNVTDTPTLVMHVDSIDMELVRRSGGWTVYALATVTILDSYGNPVSGARVYGHWEDAISDNDSGTTNNGGEVTLRSFSLRRPAPGATFTFVVDNVTRADWTYNASANNETSDSIVV